MKELPADLHLRSSVSHDLGPCNMDTLHLHEALMISAMVDSSYGRAEKCEDE